MKYLYSIPLFFLWSFPFRGLSQSDSLQKIIDNKKSSASQKLAAYVGLTEYFSIKDFDKPIALYETGKALVKQAEDSVAYARLARNTGVAYYFKGQYEKAAALYYEAITVWEKRGEKKQLAFALNDLAKLYRKTRDLNNALLYYNRARQLFTDLRDSLGIQMILNESGVVYEYKENFSEAIRH